MNTNVIQTKPRCDSVLAVRIPHDLRDSLKAAADQDGRSMSSYAVRILAQHIKGLSA